MYGVSMHSRRISCLFSGEVWPPKERIMIGNFTRVRVGRKVGEWIGMEVPSKSERFSVQRECW